MTKAGTPRAVLIAGPTASGKSRLAVELARALDGTVINTDALQVYSELRILTARPTADEEAAAPHRLYGHVSARQRYSVGAWLADAVACLGTARMNAGTPIFVGGTGLYFKALTEGLAPVPAIPAEVRERLSQRLEREGAGALHDELAHRDPTGAAKIRPSDPTRILRALEVLDATGKPLSDWHKEAATEPAVRAPEAVLLVVDPPRERLADNIRSRLRAMVSAGAVEEAARYAALGIDPKASASKALGLQAFIDHAAGRIGLEEAIERAAVQTSQYAKRQMTWFRNQMPAWTRIDPARTGAVRLAETLT